MKATDHQATRVKGKMLLSSKHEELPESEREYKGRFVLQGCWQWDVSGKTVAKTVLGGDLVSAPIQVQELKILAAAGTRAGKDRTVCATADEKNGFINELLQGDAVWLDLSKGGHDLVPEHLRERVAGMRQPVVRVVKAMYGLRRAVFDYEAGRDTRFVDRNLTLVEGSRCIFSYTGSTGERCFLGVFIDDQIAVGHEYAVREMHARDEQGKLLGLLEGQVGQAREVEAVWFEEKEILLSNTGRG